MANIIKLNVGGSIFTTTRSTLTRYPNSMLGAMFSERMPTTKDKEGNYWIDGNWDVFRYVLDFLRRGYLMLPGNFNGFDKVLNTLALICLKEKQIFTRFLRSPKQLKKRNAILLKSMWWLGSSQGLAI